MISPRARRPCALRLRSSSSCPAHGPSSPGVHPPAISAGGALLARSEREAWGPPRPRSDVAHPAGAHLLGPGAGPPSVDKNFDGHLRGSGHRAGGPAASGLESRRSARPTRVSKCRNETHEQLGNVWLACAVSRGLRPCIPGVASPGQPNPGQTGPRAGAGQIKPLILAIIAGDAAVSPDQDRDRLV
jgi:hypothetical protein